MKITRKEDKFILGSTVVDSTVLKGTPGLEKQLLTNALNLLKFPQRFGLTQDKGKELKFTSDIEQSGRILDVFSDAVWEYNPKTTVYEKKGKLSEVFNNKSIIFNENTGKTYYLKDGKFKKISDLNFKVSRGDEVVRELENRVQDVEKRMGDSGNRFSIVSALPANPDKDTLYIVVGEGQIEDTELQGMDLTELTAKISECITSNLNLTTIVHELQSGENAQNERMEELNNTFDGINESISANTVDITSLKNRVSTNETAISTLNTKVDDKVLELSDKTTALTTDVLDIKSDINVLEGTVNTHGTDINNIKTALEDIASSDALVQLTSRVKTNEDDIADIKSDLDNLASSDALVQLGNRVSTNEGNISTLQNALENLSPSDIEGLQEFIENNNGAIEVVSVLPENPKENTLYLISGEGNSITLTQHDIDTFRAQIKENKNTNAVQEGKIKDLENKDVQTDETISSLQTQVSAKADELEVVKSDVQEVKTKNQTLETALETTISTTNSNLENLASSINTVQTTLTTLVQDSVSELSNTLDQRLDQDELKHDEDINGLNSEIELISSDLADVKEDVKAVDDKVQGKVKIVDTVPEEPEVETLYLISEEDDHSRVVTVQDVINMENSISELTSLVQSQKETIQSLSSVIETQKNSLSTHELMLENQANIIRAQTDLINRMKAKLDMIDFDTLTLGDETYDIVIKSE